MEFLWTTSSECTVFQAEVQAIEISAREIGKTYLLRLRNFFFINYNSLSSPPTENRRTTSGLSYSTAPFLLVHWNIKISRKAFHSIAHAHVIAQSITEVYAGIGFRYVACTFR